MNVALMHVSLPQRKYLGHHEDMAIQKILKLILKGLYE